MPRYRGYQHALLLFVESAGDASFCFVRDTRTLFRLNRAVRRSLPCLTERAPAPSRPRRRTTSPRTPSPRTRKMVSLRIAPFVKTIREMMYTGWGKKRFKCLRISTAIRACGLETVCGYRLLCLHVDVCGMFIVQARALCHDNRF